ncbi:Ras GTPase-activating protein 1 [Folsomia candida]|uniref:Ras GTPase-activating protein 1 n=1 Tax=Folsomia candida TaxID=158441 RepID=A0A226EYZ1_FOLCA|nr:Ras GTPase-activating protein 1 [Folsomia candida]
MCTDRSTLNSLPFPPPPPPLNVEDTVGLLDELDNLGLEFDGDLGGDNSPTEPVTAPPENQWYHGRLDRHTTEERLRTAGKPGSYLVRESDRKPGSYVLSYLGRTGINHFRITAVCGDFYIGGRQFDSLMDLIGFYTSSDLLKKERLFYPIPPSPNCNILEPVNDKKRVVAILPYTRMPDTDELSFQKGDIFFVHNDMGDGWLWVTAHKTGEQGLIFRDLVEDLDDNIDPNSCFKWFHSNVTKEEAVDMLVKAGPGSFLVRPSDNSPGDYSLFFHINNQIQRFRIEKKGVRYQMGGRAFDCLESVIDRYRTEQIVEGHTLGHPVKKGHNDEGIYVPKEVKNPEKIYATLQECRDSCGFKKTEVCKKSGYLFKRNDKNKKWKSMFFVLQMDGTDVHLLMFESPKRTKPKGLVDLGCAYLYPLHDSFYEKPFCFQLVERALPCLATVTYLCSPSQDELQEWLQIIKPLCIPQMARAPKIARVRELRCLTLVILEAHRLPYKLVPNPMCILSLNQVKVARTKVKTGYDPVWDEDFTIDDIPPDVLTFTVTVLNKGKRAKDSEVAEITVDLKNLANGEEKEEWLPLSGITPIGEWGSLRLKIGYRNDLIMPIEEYSPLKGLLLDSKMDGVRALADVCHSSGRNTLANSLLRIFRFEKKEADLLSALVEQAIFKEAETTTLFRSDSLTTTLMDLFMKSVCEDFLRAAVSDTVNRILESKQSCELNPSKIEPGGDNCANAELLLVVLDEITENIFMAYDSCPSTLRYIFGCMQRAAMSRWPNERLVKTRVISGFIFLRLICPALLNPRQFNLVSEPPPQMAARSLVMIAKCLQNLANLVEFGGKEPYMEVVNPFILKNKERMVVFLDHLSNKKERPEPEEYLKLQGDPARDMATVHHICMNHFKDLQNLSRVQPTIKKFVTVTEMLNKHKQKYREMIRT